MNEVALVDTHYETTKKETAPSRQGVRNLLENEQPREKLMQNGADVLTESELIAILLRSGSKGMNVLETARSLLEQANGLHQLARCDWEEISRIKGIGKVKAITLMATFELARRLNQDSDKEKIVFRQPEEVYGYFGPVLRDLHKEVFIVAYVNSAKILLSYDKISIGGSNATIVDPPEVLRRSVMNRAHGIILVHNHPSGNNRPSRADIQLTKRIHEGAKMVGIDLVDHLIVAGYQYTSLKSEGLLS
ncbi:MAG: DNA repair protein RadC [Balneolales bacterium]|nr:DNA repair protein RadC [Balneolales bacterium]